MLTSVVLLPPACNLEEKMAVLKQPRHAWVVGDKIWALLLLLQAPLVRLICILGRADNKDGLRSSKRSISLPFPSRPKP
jgi:hypothetical protein